MILFGQFTISSLKDFVVYMSYGNSGQFRREQSKDIRKKFLHTQVLGTPLTAFM